ncbi:MULTISPECIES: hypothetical protein [unclassified Campylobacter]|uniref:hypothetical protein n=1 Tax=unclassified Campylobacter TaxID=2593542 RepID=UPI001474A4B0|nr:MULTISPECIES: hypothetical protein [unclassified Campylobacter]
MLRNGLLEFDDDFGKDAPRYIPGDEYNLNPAKKEQGQQAQTATTTQLSGQIENKTNTEKNQKDRAEALRGDEVAVDISEVSESEILELRKRYTSQFHFAIKWLNDYTELLREARPSTYPQIELKAIQNFAFLLAHGGFNMNCFYMLDLSDTGTGKGVNFKTQNKLLFEPIKDNDRELWQEHKNRIDEQVKNNEISKAEAKTKLIRSIHKDEASVEALAQCFESSKVQMLEVEELGNAIKSDKKHPLIDFVTKMHATKDFISPTYKNGADTKPYINDVSFFFYGDTNLTYLPAKTLKFHLEGGFLNRCIIVYCKNVLSFEEAQYLEIPANKIEAIQELSREIYDFAKEQSKENQINDRYLKTSEARTEFLKQIRSSIQEYNRAYDETHNENNRTLGLLNERIDYKLDGIIQTLHLLKEFTRYKEDKAHFAFNDLVSDETIKEAIAFLNGYLDFEPILNKINKFSIADRIELRERILNYVSSQRLPISLRDVYRKFTITKNELINLTRNNLKIENGKIIALIL